MRAVITAVGVVTAAGSGMAALSGAVARGSSLAQPITAFDASSFPVPDAAEVRGLDPRKLARTPKDAKILARSAVLALAALADLQSGLGAPFVSDPWRSGLFLGVGLEQGDHQDMLAMLVASRHRGRVSLTKLASEGMSAMNPLSSLKTLPNMSLAHIGIKLGDAAPRGANAAYSPFDAASLDAIAAAAEAVLSGECEVALAGGVDAPVSLFGMTTFHRLGMLKATRPLGEAAALFVVETLEHALLSGRTPLAEILGVGSACDDNPPGVQRASTVASAARKALLQAGVGELAGIVGSVGKADGAAFGWAGLPLFAVHQVFGETAAAGGALATAVAISRLRGTDQRMLVCAGAFGGEAAAMVLQGVPS